MDRPASDLEVDSDSYYIDDERYKQIYVIQASSAGHSFGTFSRITINDEKVNFQPNENNHDRGLHIVIINPFNGQIESAKVFDTYESSAALNKFILEDVPQSYIVVAACKDECSTNLSGEAK